MEKGWKTAPWQVRVIFVYWVIWFLPIVIGLGLYIFTIVLYADNDINVSIIGSMPFEFLKQEFETSPFTTGLAITESLITFLGVFYAWRILKGSGVSRAIVEMFSWFLLLTSSVYLLFPEAVYTQEELKLLLGEAFWYTVFAWVLFSLEMFVLYLVRSRRVREYADIF